jgi:hypothetical protein
MMESAPLEQLWRVHKLYVHCWMRIRMRIWHLPIMTVTLMIVIIHPALERLTSGSWDSGQTIIEDNPGGEEDVALDRANPHRPCWL